MSATKISSLPEAPSSAPALPKVQQPSPNKSSIVDITERIEGKGFGRDEVVLVQPKQPREGGPCYAGVIRLSDGRYFSVGVWKFQNSLHQLRLRERDRAGNLENGARAVCWLEQQPLESGSAHYQSAFYLCGKIYRVALWVRTYGEKKVLEVKLCQL